MKRMLNLGCGRVILPGPKPAHHGLIDDNIHDYPLWWNVDREAGEGVDEVVDLFRYPWPWQDGQFCGALVAHLAEHIPHEVNYPLHADIDGTVRERLPVRRYSDGWFAFFSELNRVLHKESQVYILSPWANSQGALADPTHTRQLIPATFLHTMVNEDEDAPFRYERGLAHYALAERPDAITHALTAPYAAVAMHAGVVERELQKHLDVCLEFSVILEVRKT